MMCLPATLLLCAAALAASAAEPLRPSAVNTNSLVIISDGGARFTRTNAVWRHRVRAADTNLYIECELLTATFTTNTAGGRITRVPRDDAARVEDADSTTRLDRIVAETNVMIITRGAQIIGDRAVYTASNDLMIVTGELVMAVDKKGSIVGTRVLFDARAETFTVEGNTMFIAAPEALSRTNTPSPRRNTNTPPRFPK